MPTVYDRRTGKMRQKNMKRSRIMKMAAKRHRRKKVPLATKRKISKSLVRARRMNRSKFGKRTRWR